MEVKHWEVLPGVTAWLAGLDGVAPEEWEPLYRQMDPARQARCARYARPGDAKRCVLADALARLALSQRSGQPEEIFRFQLRPGGKPFVPGLGVEFSLSHSGSLVLCAAAPFPVGADLQRARPVSSALAQKMARAGYPGGTREDFFSWWVRQEAVGKLSGQGLQLSPLPAPALCHVDALDGPDGRYWYCVCAEGPQNT